MPSHSSASNLFLQNNPTYEFFPSKGDPVGLNILTTTLPANLFPLTWLLPSGNLFIQTNWGTEVFDYKTNTEYELDDIPHAYVPVQHCLELFQLIDAPISVYELTRPAAAPSCFR